MTKVISLSEQTIIDGAVYRKGQVVQVEDSFNTNIKNVLVISEQQKQQETVAKELVKPVKVKEGKDG